MTRPGWSYIRVPVALLDRLSELGRAISVYLVLARHVDANGECFPGHETISIATGLPPRTVRQYLTDLEKAGLIQRRRRRRGNVVFTLPEMRALSKTGNGLPVKESLTGSFQHQDRQKTTVKTGNGLPTEVNTRTKPQNQTKVRGYAAGIEIPDSLDTDSFKSAWADWLAYRRERRLTTTERTVKAQLANLAAWGETAAVEAIRDSIANGWQGLFRPKLKDLGSGSTHESAWSKTAKALEELRADVSEDTAGSHPIVPPVTGPFQRPIVRRVWRTGGVPH